MVSSRWRQLRVGAFAAAAVLVSACSQNMLSSGGGNVTAVPASANHIAPQARAMLSLAGHGANHSVIGRGEVSPAVRKPKPANAIYDSIVVNKSGKTSSYIASEGFECCSTKEFGDGLVFTKFGAQLNVVSVILSSWGCESGFWYSDNCLTTKGSNFEEPITANVYAVTTSPSGSPAPGQLLATQTDDFYIPYRPSANNQRCYGSALGAFVGPVDKKCDFGLSVRISFNFKNANVVLPQEAIVSVAYNTSDAGYNPYGQNTPCFTGPGGCGYDALNVSAWGNGGFVGGNVDPNGVFDNFGYPSNYCNGTGNGSGMLQLDTPCWTGYHPEIEVTSI